MFLGKTFFAIRMQVLCLQRMLYGGANKETFGNTNETLTLNVHRFFSFYLHIHAAHDEDVEFVSQMQK